MEEPHMIRSRGDITCRRLRKNFYKQRIVTGKILMSYSRVIEDQRDQIPEVRESGRQKLSSDLLSIQLMD